MHTETEHVAKPRWGLIITAVIILLAGLAVGIPEISNSVELHNSIPTRKEIRQIEEYRELLYELHEIVNGTTDLEEIDVDALVDEMLEDTSLTRSQQRAFREYCEEVIESVPVGVSAADEAVEREAAANSVLRRIPSVPDPESIARRAKHLFIIGASCIGISFFIAVCLFIPAVKKRKRVDSTYEQ